MIFSLYSHWKVGNFAMKFHDIPRYLHDFLFFSIFPWFSNFPMIFPWFSHLFEPPHVSSRWRLSDARWTGRSSPPPPGPSAHRSAVSGRCRRSNVLRGCAMMCLGDLGTYIDDMIWNDMIWYDMVWYDMLWFDITLYIYTYYIDIMYVYIYIYMIFTILYA